MFPRTALVCLLVALLSASAAVARPWRLLRLQAKGSHWRNDRPWERLRRVLLDGLVQRRVRNYRWAGLAHAGIFLGFLLLLPRTVVLLGRAFEPSFGSLRLENCSGLMLDLRCLYPWVKTVAALVVLLGTGVFVGLRLSRRTQRLRPSAQGMGILGAITTMMLADLLYEAVGAELGQRVPLSNGYSLAETFVAPFLGPIAADPPAQLLLALLRPLSDNSLLVLGLAGYGLHVGLVLTFLLVIPHTKHLHLVTAWPNLFFDSLAPTGKLEPIARSPDELLALVETSMLAGEASVGRLGKAALRDFTAQERLGWFACTECGRCTEHCPAAATGKLLDPRELTLRLRARLNGAPRVAADQNRYMNSPLVPSVIAPEALWACTNCGACEEQCPVAVRYISSIVDMRRDLLLMRGEAPISLQRPFDGVERQRNPWNLPREQRAHWAEGLGVKQLKDVSRVEYLYWVGCAASYDGRAQSVARALVRLMNRANVTFAILGAEEACTGDAARRAGNELLFLQLAHENIALLNRYQAEGRFSRIITTCPHCLTTLSNDYSDLGGRYDVMAHSVAIERWVVEGRLALEPRSEERITYHDPCTLARGAGITEAPRRLIAELSGVNFVEPTHCGRHTSCCGAGGAQMWLEEPNAQRINLRRTQELSEHEVQRIVSACPFCLTMIGDAACQLPGERKPIVCDIAELVDLHCRDA